MRQAPILSTASRVRRRRRSAAEIAALVAKYRSSSLTQKAFAASEGLSFSTLTGWLRRYRDGELGGGDERTRLVRVNVTDAIARSAQSLSTFELDLRDGTQLRIPQGFDGPSLRALLEILSERC